MTIHNLYIFDRTSACLFYEEWHRTKKVKNIEEEFKLMYGLLFSLKSFVIKISPKPVDTFNSFKTDTYKLHYYESASGIRLVLLTDPEMGDLKETLKKLYNEIYVEYVVKNPVHKVGEKISCEKFSNKLNEYISSCPGFRPPT